MNAGKALCELEKLFAHDYQIYMWALCLSSNYEKQKVEFITVHTM